MPKSLYRPEHDLLLRLLREARTNAGLTQRQLAERLGKPQSYVSKVESGERRMDVIEFYEFCQSVGSSSQVIIAQLDGLIRAYRS